MVREKIDTNPVLFKLGVAVAISIGGIFFSFLRPRRMKRSISPSPSGLGNPVDSEGVKALVKDEALENSENQADISLITNSYSQNEDKDETHLLEFEEIIKDFNMSSPRAYISSEKDVEPFYTYESELEHMKMEEYKQDIETLNNRVEFLQNRVSTLETELLKYYGLKEQENTITELQNRVKIHNTEAKLFNLKIEALQVENRKMKAQMVDYSKTVSELEAAKETIDFLKKKLKAETEQNKKQLLSLQERVKKMQDLDVASVSGDKSIELKLQKIRELEKEAEELRRGNSSLREEKLELAQKLEQAQVQADAKVEAFKEETQNLRQENEELKKQVEELQSSWCSDIEELVYLRWINACLRYEVRNYQPEPGKTISRDLSKNLSPKSEQKAKHLIMEYANKQGLEEKGRHLTDSDFDQWSFSQFSNSNLSDNGEFDDDDDSSLKTETSSKKRIFGKLRQLLRGEDEKNPDNNHGSSDSCLNFPEKNEDGRRIGRRLSIGSERYLKGIKSEELKELERRRRNSDIGLPRVYKSFENVAQNQVGESSGLAEKRFQLARYAGVLKDASEKNLKFHRRAVSHS